MQRLLHANAWISVGLGIFLTGSYYISFFHQISDFQPITLIVVMTLVFIQIRSSVAFVRFLLAFVQRVRFFLPKLLAKIITFSVLLFMIVDGVTLFFFNMKFSVAEGGRLILGSIGDDALISFNIVAVALLSFCVFWILVYLFFLSNKVYIVSRGLLLVLVGWIVLSLSTASFLQSLSGPYLGSLLINPLLYNINELLQDNDYASLNYKQELGLVTKDYASYFHTIPGSHQKKNVIVIFAESFGPTYSAANASGFHDWLPHYDKMAQDGVQYNRFLSPGCASEHAHTSFLQGLFPIYYGDIFSSGGYQKFDGYVQPLPQFLNEQGYDTFFVSTSRLDFLDQKGYLQEQGFATIVGEESFATSELYTFESAPDGDLYDKSISIVQEKLITDKPFYLNIQTISTHLPRNSPYGKTEEDTRRYADDEIGDFYKKLRQTDFFDNGLLVIFGDHRVPLVATEQEKKALGYLWPSKVLATVIGTDNKGEISDMIVQPIDLHFSLKSLIADDDVLVWDYYNDIFNNIAGRDWGLFHCKYKSNDVILMDDDYRILDMESKHPAVGFVDLFKRYQFFKNTIGSRALSSFSSTAKVSDSRDLMLIGHGGAQGYAPSNTMSGFVIALQQGAHGIEIDLSYTFDNVNVVRHGPYPTSSCMKGKTIDKLLYKDMRKECKTDNGESILTFDELLSLTKNIMPLYMVELKVYDPTKRADQMYDAISTVKYHGLEDKVIFVSYHPEVRKYFVTRDDLRSGRDMFNGDDYPSAEEIKNIEYLMTPFYELTGDHLMKLLSYKIPLITYTPSNAKEMEDVLFLKDYLHVPISGILVDDIPLFLQLYQQ